MMTHLEFDELAELAAQPETARPPHISRCDRCRDELETLATMLATMRDDPGVEPSPATLARAHDLFGTRERLAGLGRRLQRVVGQLTLDSGSLVPAAAGARGASASARQLLFMTEAVELDLSHTLGSEPFQLQGQALPVGEGGDDLVALRPVVLRPTGGEGGGERLSTTDPAGGFRFADLQSGGYELEFELDDRRLVVAFEVP